ncbi:MAG TPA: MFS transporter [Actinoplanes sp.]
MPARATARQWTGLAVLAVPCFLVSLDAEVLNLAAPQLATDLRPSNVQLLWIMDSYVFVVAGLLIAMGVLGDRVGRRRLLLVGAAAFGLASLLAAYAPGPAWLIAARVLMGVAGASLMPSTLALIRVMFPDGRQRALALGGWSASFSLGGVGAPLIGGVLLEHFWWGSVFLIALPATVLLMVLGPVLLPESRDRGAGRFDIAGALLSLAAVLSFVYGVKELAAEGVRLVPLSTIAAAALLGAVFLGRQRRTAYPLLDLTIFREPRVTVALTGNALSYFVLYGSQLAIAQYLQLVLGLSPLEAGLRMLPSVLAFLGASLSAPFLSRVMPAGRAITAGLLLMSLGFALLAAVGAGGGVAAVVAGTVIFSIGLAPVYILSTELVVSTVRPGRAGMAAAVTETSAELGGALGIAILGSVGVAAFRHGMTGTPLPAGGTLADAAATAGDLPARAGAELLRVAGAAYTWSFTLVALIAAGSVAVAAMVAWRVLRPAPAAAATAAADAQDRAEVAAQRQSREAAGAQL